MAIRKVIIELRDQRVVPAFAAGPTNVLVEPPAALGAVGGLRIDPSFSALPMPPRTTQPGAPAGAYFFAAGGLLGDGGTYLVRGEIDDAAAPAVAAAVAGTNDIVGIYADVGITTCPVCPGSPAMGNHQ